MTQDDTPDAEKGSQNIIEDQKGAELPVPNQIEPAPDGGYGWVVLFCLFWSNASTWGLNSTFGVYLSFFVANDYYPGATTLKYSFVGGLSIGLALFVAPLSNYLAKRYHFKVPMIIGIILFSGGQICAAFTTEMWQLFLTQGVMFGAGNGFILSPTIPLTQQWFNKRRAMAAGVGAAGSGFGGLVFSITTRIIIQRHGLKWAFITNGLVSLGILILVTIFVKSRSKAIGAKFEPLQLSLLVHPSFGFIWIWGVFSMCGYVIALYILPTFAVQALGLSQSQGSTLQAILCGGQMIGRPLCGLALDRYGRLNMAAAFTFVSGLSILLIWLNARTFGVLVFFAIVQGIVGGVFWQASAPCTAEAVGVRDLGSALAILWLAVVLPCLFSSPIAAALADLCRDQGRTGADVYLPAIGFAGACFIIASVVILPAKFKIQQSYKLFVKA